MQDQQRPSTFCFRRRAGATALVVLLACGEEPGPVATPPPPPEPPPVLPAPPGIDSTIPGAGATGVPVGAAIAFIFNRNVDTATASGAITLTTGGHPLAGETSLSDSVTLVFHPTTPLDFGSDVQATLSDSVRTTADTLIPAPPPLAFRTEGSPLPYPEPDSLRAYVGVLAHDSLRGRGSGTPDEARAAAYLAARMADFGLDPLGGGHTLPFTALSSGNPVSSRNVVGVVPGAGVLASEWVIVGAHYDHVGLRMSGGVLTVHNGADDNASGTAVVLELGRLFSQAEAAGSLGDAPRRSVLFAFWGAEEVGLLGSCHFASSGVIPIPSISSLLNFDMVGRLRDDAAQARGQESSPLWPTLLQDSNRESIGLENAEGCRRCTDQACFLEKGVPYVWFFTGFHEEYHRPGDDAELLAYEGMAGIARIALRALNRLTVRPEGPPPG